MRERRAGFAERSPPSERFMGGRSFAVGTATVAVTTVAVVATAGAAVATAATVAVTAGVSSMFVGLHLACVSLRRAIPQCWGQPDTHSTQGFAFSSCRFIAGAQSHVTDRDDELC